MELITTLATVGIFLVAWIQLNHMREESKRERTLTMCFKYDTDPIISEIVKCDRNEEKLDDHQTYTLLNYFDVLAIGVAQDSYEYKIIYAQFKNIIPIHVEAINPEQFETDYPDLSKLLKKIREDLANERGA
jgi:hypothetical protein